MKTVKQINAEIARQLKLSERIVSKLKEQKKKVCPHKNIKRHGFFQSTTAHEWDQCEDCGEEFNHISFPA